MVADTVTCTVFVRLEPFSDFVTLYPQTVMDFGWNFYVTDQHKVEGN